MKFVMITPMDWNYCSRRWACRSYRFIPEREHTTIHAM